MPTYQYECGLCGAVQELVRRVADRNDPVRCPCQDARDATLMTRVILTPPMGQVDLAPYIAVAGDRAGKPIEGRKAHREFLARNNFREAGDRKLPPRPEPFRKIAPTRADVVERRETLRRVLRQKVPLETLRKTSN